MGRVKSNAAGGKMGYGDGVERDMRLVGGVCSGIWEESAAGTHGGKKVRSAEKFGLRGPSRFK